MQDKQLIIIKNQIPIPPQLFSPQFHVIIALFEIIEI